MSGVLKLSSQYYYITLFSIHNTLAFISPHFSKLLMICYIWLSYSIQLERIKVLPCMLSRDLRSQGSPLCPEEESQMAKIRSPLTPQGEEERITARIGGPQTLRSGLSRNPQTQQFNQKSVVTPGWWWWCSNSCVYMCI